MTGYRAPRWLPGGHAQTIYPLLIKPAPPPYRRERWQTPDGDFIDLDWAGPPATAGSFGGTPLLILFHGLEGSSRSHYAIALMNACAAVGWTGVVVHFRGCSGELNRLPRAYHSGDSAEIDWILRRLQLLFPQAARYAVGVSLGGNALLKWLGEQGTGAVESLRAAAAVSAPLDLSVSGHHLARGCNRVYTRHFLQTLKRKAAAKLRHHPGLFDERRMRAARNLYEFDDVVTAPLHGFAGADDYWRRASSKPWLTGIRLPTLLLNACNDPFLPAQVLPTASQAAAGVRREFPAEGGHVGFVAGRLPGRLDWLPQRLLHYFQDEV
ncbi:MAG: hydrolase [Rhodobacteraceae bacterium]|nr:hydrolase [Paracoccaceae bacterium]